MAIQQLATASNKAVGMKQTKKAVEKGEAKLVFLAKDADDHIVIPLQKICQLKSIEVHMVESMEVLGEACGIQVGAAAAAILGK